MQQQLKQAELLPRFERLGGDVERPKRPHASDATMIKRSDFGLRLSTALLITFAVGWVLLQLNLRFGVPVESLNAPIF